MTMVREEANGEDSVAGNANSNAISFRPWALRIEIRNAQSPEKLAAHHAELDLLNSRESGEVLGRSACSVTIKRRLCNSLKKSVTSISS
jgi:hypothetical protein